MTDTTMLHIRVDADTKEQAAEALAHMGLTMSDAVRLLLHRVVADQAFPLELKVPNSTTRAAMLEARTLAKARFERAEDLFDGLKR